MKKIITKEQKKKKSKRNQWILVSILIFILLGSTFGVIVNSFNNSGELDKIEYNGYSFIYSNGFWIINKGNYNLGFTYNPLEIENLDVKIGILDNINSYANVPVYIYSENSNSEIEIYRNLYSYAERIQKACPEEKDCIEDIPIKDCTNRMIIIEKSEKEEIIQKNKCVYIKGKEENLIKLSDEFLYRIHGIK